MDTNPNLSENSTILDETNKDQIHKLSRIINITAMISTDFNEPTTAVHFRRKGVFKRFRRWAGKRSRAICRVWPRHQRTDNHEEVIGKMIIMLIEYVAFCHMSLC